MCYDLFKRKKFKVTPNCLNLSLSTGKVWQGDSYSKRFGQNFAPSIKGVPRTWLPFLNRKLLWVQNITQWIQILSTKLCTRRLEYVFVNGGPSIYFVFVKKTSLKHFYRQYDLQLYCFYGKTYFYDVCRWFFPLLNL